MSDAQTIRHSSPHAVANPAFDSGARQLRIFGALAVLLYALETGFTVYGTMLGAQLRTALVARDEGAVQATAQQMIAMGEYAFLDYVLVICGIGALFVAMYGARKAMAALGRQAWQFGYGWTVGSIVIPFWNFYRPWVGLGEIDRVVEHAAQTGRIDAGPQPVSGATRLLGFVFVVGGIVVRTCSRMLDDVGTSGSREGLVAELDNFATYATIMAIAFGAITLAFAFFLLRQHRNLRQAGRAFNLR